MTLTSLAAGCAQEPKVYKVFLPGKAHSAVAAQAFCSTCQCAQTVQIVPVVTFDTDVHSLTTRDEVKLAEFASHIRRFGRVHLVKIDGSADIRGGQLDNYNLSSRRAESVYDKLVDEGVRPEVLDVAGLGEQTQFGDLSQNRIVRATVFYGC